MISNQPHSDQPHDMRERAHEMTEQAREKMKEGAGRVQEQVRSMADDAKKRGRSMVEGQKHQLAEKLHHTCSALQAAARQLHEQNDDNIASYAEAISERIEDAADYIDRVEVDEMIDNVEGFARRQPHLFLGGMFLVGLAAARFLKASQSSEPGSRSGSQSQSQSESQFGSQSQSQSRSGMSGMSGQGGQPYSGSTMAGRGDSRRGEADRGPSNAPGMPGSPGQSQTSGSAQPGSTFPSQRDMPGSSSSEGRGPGTKTQQTSPGTLPEQGHQHHSEHHEREDR